MENFIDALFTALLSALGVFIIRWVDAITKHLDELTKLINELTQRVDAVERDMMTKDNCALARKELEQDIVKNKDCIAHIEQKIGNTRKTDEDRRV